MDKLLEYFAGDEAAANTWLSKYCVKDGNKVALEETPDDMHKRMAKEFAKEEYNRINLRRGMRVNWNEVSQYGREREALTEEIIYNYFKDFKQIVPQGSIMDILGNSFKVGSLSNCFVVGQPYDSYGGIFQKDQQLAQLAKRRGGVGIDISSLRPESTAVTNAAGSSTGAVSFMHRYSNTTREVAQKGRRGALMITIDCRHPDLGQFIDIKKDLTQVTGANISVKLRDDFMRAVEADEDYLLRWPCEGTVKTIALSAIPYNELCEIPHTNEGGARYIKKVKAKELYDVFVENNWLMAEPGSMFVDRHWNYSPDGVYPQYRMVTTNPCGEIGMGEYDACRLLALNFMSIVRNPYTDRPSLDMALLYQLAYEQQYMADIVVDMELNHIQNILFKIDSDPEPEHIKREERELWENIYRVASGGRRTGGGFTALGDMLAAFGMKYGTEEANIIVDKVMKVKMEAELDCSIDLAIQYGAFEGWDKDKELSLERKVVDTERGKIKELSLYGRNPFYQMVVEEFPDQAKRMWKWGRRNVSWSTVAPTGTVSLMTQTTGGLEPLFSLEPYYRKKKINPTDENTRVDFVDKSGDKWQEFPIIHPQVIEWWKVQLNADDDIAANGAGPFTSLEVREMLETATKEVLTSILEQSPWHGATANDISWEGRVKLQAIIQKYTSHSISSTINLPKDVSKDVVSDIYMQAWKAGLKGITIYRDTCRDGVLTRESHASKEEELFPYYNSPERPTELDAEMYTTMSKGNKYAVVIGFLEGKPYEVFAFIVPKGTGDHKGQKGKIIKSGKGHYTFDGEVSRMDKMELSAENAEEAMLCRMMSMMLRHGAKVADVVKQVNKVDLITTSFTKAVSRVLKNFIKDGEETEEMGSCPSCHEADLIREEGCRKCPACGYSAC